MFVSCKKIELPSIMMRKVVDEVKLERLAKSIRKLGVIVPLVIKKKGDNFELVAGFRRLMACMSINENMKVPCVIMKDGQLAEAVKVAENVEREDVVAVDEGEYFVELMEANGWTQKQLANELGVSEAYVSQRMQTLTWDEKTKELVRTGDLKWSVARELEGVKDENDRRRLIDVAVRSGVTPAIAQQWKIEANRMREQEQQTITLPKQKDRKVQKVYVPCQTCDNPVEVNNVRFIRVCSDCQSIILNPPSEK